MEKISWHAPEYWHTEKGSDWYWIVAIITISIVVISIFFNNIIFGLLILVASFTLSLFASRRPAVSEIKIDGLGVSVGKTIYPYKYLGSFWIETRESVPRVLIRSKKTFMPLLTLFVDEVEPEEIKAVLAKHLPEEELREPLLEKILIYLGF